ncbi:hypothetical protein OS493_005219 [Desmophyllum pertusum]|uniref:EGF-like domain-containing protein n=1 Tax=Desmophyllum pertusum TaxID=174260 RepID=A0A9W9Z461_9CNID|nr:hypothetical protein OS493_005219 [Desmophyllum pertusum]
MFTDANADKIVFLNFVSYFDSVLNVSAIVSKFTSSTEDCQFLCMTTLNCLSVNVAIGSDLSEGRHLCQLLNTTKNSKRDDDFKPSDTFHHFTTIVSPCFSQPCQRGGTCHQDYGMETFTCQCVHGREGKLCEIGTGWSKVNINGSVCFGVRDDSYGNVTVQVTGKVITAKLVHVSGSVANSRAADGGNWGNPRSRQIRTVITSDANEVLLPHNYTAYEPYTLEGYASMSPELVFPNASEPASVPRGMGFRIWFVEDLGNYSEQDNSGESCVDMFLFYV